MLTDKPSRSPFCSRQLLSGLAPKQMKSVETNRNSSRDRYRPKVGSADSGATRELSPAAACEK
jgi:hypothetical protein